MSACISESNSSAPSDRRRGAVAVRAVRWLAPVLAVLSSSPAAAQEPSETLALMNALSQRFRSLEQTLGQGDLVQAHAVAGDLRALLGEHPPHTPKNHAAREDLFVEQVARLSGAITEVIDLTDLSNLPGAGQAFEEMRAACVSCHVRFRSNNDVRGLYPARANTVVGTIELSDVDGEPRPNRAWVLAFLEGRPDGPPYVHARRNPRISQSKRRFEPRVLPVIVGTEVEFPNDDTIFHNVFSLSKTAPFDLGVYEPGHSSSVRMKSSGLVKVYCNIHPEMAASIVVLDNPWFALTDRSGQFVISGVPDGDYVLRGWNDMGAESRVSLSLHGGALVETRLALRETRRSLAHNDKHGNRYPSKY